jgi:leader peptidase (prepilin peptidase)/N-methyltransferase
MLPLLLIVSAGLGALIGLVVQMLMPRLRGQAMPFGPFLALAGWVGLLVGDDLMALYLALLY